MKKRWILLVSIVLFQTILTGCASKTPQLPEECLAQNMLISKEDIGATFENPLMSPLSHAPANSAVIDFAYPAPAYFKVIQYKDKIIQSVYQSRAEFVFRSDEGSHSWVKPPDVLFESDWADEYDYQCGSVWDENRCQYIARYKGYLIYLSLDTGPDGYSLEDFSAGMAAIDREVGECFAALEEDS